jgi:hypothetical protein
MIELNLELSRLVNLPSPSQIKALRAGAHAHSCNLSQYRPLNSLQNAAPLTTAMSNSTAAEIHMKYASHV